MDSARTRKAYRKWLTAKALLYIRAGNTRFQNKMRKRERRYRDAKYYGLIAHRRAALECEPSRVSHKACIFVDVTRSYSDPKINGLNRVARKLTASLLKLAPPEIDIAPVRFDQFGEVWRYAICDGAPPLGTNADSLGPAVAFQPGDIFLALDWHPTLFAAGGKKLLPVLNSGARVISIVYDILPLQYPGFFVADLPHKFRQWADGIVERSDAILCISSAVATDVKNWLNKSKPGQPHPKIEYFHLGSDFADRPTLRSVSTKPSPADASYDFLMVGSIEPRKGYRQALEAFRMLWDRGINARLTIVGRRGWLVDQLAADLQTHSNQQLRWLPNASDGELATLYRTSTALIAASEAEGFGLPLVEAAYYSLPVIARDIPVFREILKDGAHFFGGTKPDDLADAIDQWIGLQERGAAPPSSQVSTLSWQDSASQLLRLIQSRGATSNNRAVAAA